MSSRHQNQACRRILRDCNSALSTRYFQNRYNNWIQPVHSTALPVQAAAGFHSSFQLDVAHFEQDPGHVQH